MFLKPKLDRCSQKICHSYWILSHVQPKLLRPNIHVFSGVSCLKDLVDGPPENSCVLHFSIHPDIVTGPAESTQSKSPFYPFLMGPFNPRLEPLMPALVRDIQLKYASNLFFWVMMLITPPVPSMHHILADGEVMTFTDFDFFGGICLSGSECCWLRWRIVCCLSAPGILTIPLMRHCHPNRTGKLEPSGAHRMHTTNGVVFYHFLHCICPVHLSGDKASADPAPLLHPMLQMIGQGDGSPKIGKGYL